MSRMLVRSLGLALVVGAAAWWRSRIPREQRDRRIRKWANEHMNPFLLRAGMLRGGHSELGCLEHTGRRSGVVRRSPVHPIPLKGRFAVPLAYGERGQWPRNVLAASGCRLQFRSDVYELGAPRVMEGRDVEGLPTLDRAIGRLLSGQFMVMDVIAMKPGTLDGTTERALTPAVAPA